LKYFNLLREKEDFDVSNGAQRLRDNGMASFTTTFSLVGEHILALGHNFIEPGNKEFVNFGSQFFFFFSVPCLASSKLVYITLCDKLILTFIN
jgi:hypothetical protein